MCREPALTTRTATFDGVLDYIFVSVPHWHVVRTLRMPYEEPDEAVPPSAIPVKARYGGLGPIPNATFPSDHLAMACDLAL